MGGRIILPPRQATALDKAIAERLGVDMSKVSSSGFNVSTDGDDAYIRWEGVAVIPAEEFVAMFNAAGEQPVPPDPPTLVSPPLQKKQAGVRRLGKD